MKYAIAAWGAALAVFAGVGETRATVVDLGWMAGHWCSEKDGERIDEVWLPAVDGSLHGLSRTVAGAKVASFEFLRIEVVDGTPTFHAQPNGASATAFALVEQTERSVSFENLAHDFPQRIEYRADGEQLQAQISGPGSQGQEMVIPFVYRRCD